MLKRLSFYLSKIKSWIIISKLIITSNFLFNIMSGRSTKASTRVLDCADDKFYASSNGLRMCSVLCQAPAHLLSKKMVKVPPDDVWNEKGQKMGRVDYKDLMVLTFSVKCTHGMLDMLWNQLLSYISECMKFVSWREKICGSEAEKCSLVFFPVKHLLL